MESKRYPALQYRDFRLLWSTQFISNAGSQMQIVAINWHIYLLTNSPLALGLIGLFRFLPIFLFSLPGGTFADVHNRKKVMLVTQCVLALLSIILTIMTFSGNINPIIIYIITIASAIALSFDTPARQALIPNLVERKDMANAMSLNTIMFQVARIVGPTLAGFLIARVSIGSVYAINAISFLTVIGALIAMRTTGEPQGTPVQLSFSSAVEGLKFVKSKTIIWSSMVLDFFSTFFSSATALLPIFAKDILHVGPEGLGMLYAADSVGALGAGFLIAHKGTIRNQGKLLLAAVALYAAGTIIFGLSRIFWISLVAFFLIGIGDSISTIIRNTIRQLSTPDHLRGRMTSVNMIFFMGGPQLGEFEAGLLAAAAGAPFSVVIGGIGTLIVVGIMTVAVPTLRKYTGHEDEEVIVQKA